MPNQSFKTGAQMSACFFVYKSKKERHFCFYKQIFILYQ